MNGNVLSLIFFSFLKLGSSFDLAAARSINQDDGVTEFPFRQAKVKHKANKTKKTMAREKRSDRDPTDMNIKYHRSRYCITAFGETNCVRMEESPGDAAKIAKLYRIWTQGYEPSPNKILRTILRVHRNIKMNQLRQGKPKQAVLNHIVKQNNLKQRTNEAKMSQTVKQGKLTQSTNKAKLSQPVKQGKLSHNIKPAKQTTKQPNLSQPVKQGDLKGNLVYWNVAGHQNHVAPIPRLTQT